MSPSKLAALSKVAAFAGLPQAIRERLAEMSGLQRIGRGSVLFRDGEPAHFVYILVEGRISLLAGHDADETIIDFLEAGDVALIPPALLDLPYMATGRATTDLLALLIPADAFRGLAEDDLSLASAISRMLATHWRSLLKHLKHAKTRDADTRIAQYLLDNIDAGAISGTVILPGSRRQLAAHLGMTPETLSRSFKRLGDAGVTSSGATITVESVTRLAALAGTAQTSNRPTPQERETP
jgi:CRP/FNR family transcriptional activator FtrB